VAKLSVADILVDDVSMPLDGQETAIQMLARPNQGAVQPAYTRLDVAPGAHSLRVRSRIQIIDAQELNTLRPPTEIKWPAPVFEWTQETTSNIEVIPSDAALIELVDDENLAPAVRASIGLNSLVVALEGDAVHVVSGAVEVAKPPMDLAFDVVGRVGAREWSLGRFTAPAGHESSAALDVGAPLDIAPGVSECTVLLRPNADLAEQDVDLGNRIFGREITIERVPLVWARQ